MVRPGTLIWITGRREAEPRVEVPVSREDAEAMLMEAVAPRTALVKIRTGGRLKPITLKVPAGTRRILVEPDDWVPDEPGDNDPWREGYAPWNIIDGIELAGPRPPKGYEIFVERYFPAASWRDPEDAFPAWLVPPGVDPELAYAWLWRNIGGINLVYWPYSQAPAHAQLRSVPGDVMRIQPAESMTPLATLFVYEDGYWRSGARAFG